MARQWHGDLGVWPEPRPAWLPVQMFLPTPASCRIVVACARSVEPDRLAHWPGLLALAARSPIGVRPPGGGLTGNLARLVHRLMAGASGPSARFVYHAALR